MPTLHKTWGMRLNFLLWKLHWLFATKSYSPGAGMSLSSYWALQYQYPSSLQVCTSWVSWNNLFFSYFALEISIVSYHQSLPTICYCSFNLFFFFYKLFYTVISERFCFSSSIRKVLQYHSLHSSSQQQAIQHQLTSPLQQPCSCWVPLVIPQPSDCLLLLPHVKNYTLV